MTATTSTVPATGDTTARKGENPLARRRVVLRTVGLRKAFGGQVVLDAISTELREGEVVLLRGNNGSGKTTLLNILSGNLEPDAGSIHLQANGVTEHFEFPRSWWQNLNPFDHFTPERVAREGVGRTWQDVRLFGPLTLADNISVATPHQLGENPVNVLFRRGRISRDEGENARGACNKLAGLGLAGREQSSADRVSLGQTKRVAIARAVQAGARILFLDEPLAGLDTQGIESVLQLLSELAHEHRVTLVIVEHVFNIRRILDLADTVWTLQNGRVRVESPATVGHQEGADSDLLKWIRALLGHETTITNEPLMGDAVLWKIQTPDCEPDRCKAPLLEVCDLVVRRGRRLVIGRERPGGSVEGLFFSIARGEVALLQAPNGWGKTTLFDVISGIIPAERGEIRLAGRAIQELPIWERRKLGLVYLRAKSNVFPQLQVSEALRLACGMLNGAVIPKALLSHTVSSLSGGEKQRLAITCHPNSATCHLLDEPFSALDAETLASWQPLKRIWQDPACATLIAFPDAVESRRSRIHPNQL